MRLLGIRFYGLELFYGIMDFSKEMAIRTYYVYLENIHFASRTIYDLLQRIVVKEKRRLLLKSGMLYI